MKITGSMTGYPNNADDDKLPKVGTVLRFGSDLVKITQIEKSGGRFIVYFEGYEPPEGETVPEVLDSIDGHITI